MAVGVRIGWHRARHSPDGLLEQQPVEASVDGGAFFFGQRLECATLGGAPFGRCDPPLLWFPSSGVDQLGWARRLVSHLSRLSAVRFSFVSSPAGLSRST